jgi:DNA repair exonuclease SbcCD ATPase subunit
MRLLGISIKGFRAFAREQRMTWPENNGLYLVRGRNEAEPSLGANGAGKSTLFDAICWCLFGKTARGLYGPSIDSWGGTRGTKVSLLIELHGEPVTVARARNPNELRLLTDDSDRTVTQAELDGLLGMDYDRFLNAVLMGQFGILFPDLRPAARLELLDGILGLDGWVAASAAASDQLRSVAAQRDEAAEGVHRAQARAEALTEALTDAQDSHALWTKEHDAKVRSEAARLTERLEAAGKAQDKASALASRLTDAQDAHEHAAKLVALAGDTSGPLRDELTEIKTRLSIADDLVNKANRHATRTDQLTEGACPTCAQPLTKAGLAALKDNAQADVDTACSAYDQLDVQVRAKSRDLDAVYSVVETKVKAERRKAAEVDELQREWDRAKQALTRVRGETKVIEDKLDELRAEQPPGSHAVTQLQNRLIECADTEADAKVEHIDLCTTYGLLEYWPQGFKELRLWLVEKALEELTIHVNSSLVDLGLREWSVSFTTQREGHKQGKLEVWVRSPTSPEQVPWEAWSGAETQRLRVAIVVGIAELLRNRNPAAAFNFEVWDEPTAHLNEEGVNDLVAYFAARARDRQIWLIDHRSLDSGAFCDGITVVKDSDGAHITR